MRYLIFGLVFGLCEASVALAQSPGHSGHGGLPGQNAVHFGNQGQGPGRSSADPGSQTGTGRLGNEDTPGTGPSAFGHSHHSSTLDQKSHEGKKDDDKDPATDKDKDGAQNKLTGPARALQERLAAIDHMRDMAMKNGNARLLQVAEELEAKAKQQYAFQMSHGNRAPSPSTTPAPAPSATQAPSSAPPTTPATTPSSTSPPVP